MTSEQIDELEKLEKAATPGPWVYERSPGDMEVGYPDQFDVIAPNGDALCSMSTSDWGLAEAHGKLIPALRNAAPFLIAAAMENAKLRAVVEAARAYVEHGEGRGDLIAALRALDAKGVE